MCVKNLIFDQIFAKFGQKCHFLSKMAFLPFRVEKTRRNRMFVKNWVKTRQSRPFLAKNGPFWSKFGVVSSRNSRISKNLGRFWDTSAGKPRILGSKTLYGPVFGDPKTGRPRDFCFENGPSGPFSKQKSLKGPSGRAPQTPKTP